MRISCGEPFRRWLALAAVAAGALVSRPAVAEESAYCRKVRARAGEDAALLAWPRLVGEVHRYPRGASMGPTVADTEAQVRFGASFSPTEVWRGARLEAAADADCEAHEVSLGLLELIAEAGDAAAQRALSAQATFLASRKGEWTSLLDRARARLQAGLITVLELQELRRLAGQLERKLEFATGEEARLRARAPSVPTGGRRGPAGNLARRAEEYARRAVEVEQASADARSLEAFRVELSGGVIPSFGSAPADWYGVVEVSWSLGAPSRSAAARRERAARQDEVLHARYELPARLAEARRGLVAQAERALREVKVLEGEIATARATRDAFIGQAARGVEQAQALLDLELASLEADQVYLVLLAGALAELAD